MEEGLLDPSPSAKTRELISKHTPSLCVPMILTDVESLTCTIPVTRLETCYRSHYNPAPGKKMPR